jgi:CDP-glycerol glycerophosphotransferase (TagB/SpsB family)
MKPLGYARNDDLFRKIDVHQVFPNLDFEKVIYWLPTYRQHFWGVANHSDISMPIIYTQQDANLINECAVKNKMLIIVKVHQVQDVTKISEYNLSNLIFIKNDFFDDKDFTNYQLLGSSDAMISDYSSVYYDYLLCDKPIGLCFDDFEEYNKREGFTMDPNVILAGGEKIYNTNDFCDFIANVAQGKDLLKEKRNEIKLMCHDNIDNKSSERIVDYLEEKYLK